MAAVEFGDSELFEQLDEPVPVPKHIRFTDDEEATEEADQLREQLEENIVRLTEENQMLKRKMKILTTPSTIKVEDVNTDGPLLQILYANNSISKQCRQEIEDCICGLIQKHWKRENDNTSSVQLKPQNSAFVFEEDKTFKSSSGIKTVTEAFKVIGSVLYFTTFSVDKLGQPLQNENPQLTEGWEVPIYQQVFSHVIGSDGQDIEMKERRPKSMCFNCGSGSHQLRDCPKPKDQALINERRKEFSQSNNQNIHGNQRYHAEIEERFAKYKPGVMSEELLTALGVGVNSLPPLIYRMRQLGYPPGWLKEAEMENSGLTLYDGKEDGNVTEETSGQNISYDVSKLVDFPGFNVYASPTMKDEYMQYGSTPIQHNHMKSNFAAYLSNNFPSPGGTPNKRRHESDSPSLQRKKRRSSPACSSDMEMDSEPGTPSRFQGSSGFQFQPPLPPGSPSFSSPPPLPKGTPPATPTPPPLPKEPGTPSRFQGSSGFQFQPPLPPGSPSFSSPPPLPRGTPPATPTPPPLPKGTPPPTPTNGSPALRGRNWVVVDEAGEEMEDGLTLEELEEQQRLIWAALENADTATNSDCDTPVLGTPVASSPRNSTPAHVDTETEAEAEEVVDFNGKQRTPQREEECLESPGPMKDQNVTPQSPVPMRAEDSPLSPTPITMQEESPLSPTPITMQEESPLSPTPITMQEESPLSPTLITMQEESPLSPTPITMQEESPLSPTPIRAQEESPLSPTPIRAQEESPLSPGPIRVQEESPLSPGPIRAEESPISPVPVRAKEEKPLSPVQIIEQEDRLLNPDPVRAQKDSTFSLVPVGVHEDINHSSGPMEAQAVSRLSPVPEPFTQGTVDSISPNSGEKVIAVPHRSRFAAGIVPFEDTPEYTEVASATGTYLRIRDLLKSSPRSLARNKK